MPIPAPWRRTLAASALPLALATSGLAAAPPTAGVPHTAGAMTERSAPPAPRTAARLDAPATVTLLTGDQVTLLPTPSGVPQVILEAGEGADEGFAIRRTGERIEVIPHTVRDLVPEVLDPNLFDVAGLVAMGYDDAHSDGLPLIVRRAPGVRSLRGDPAFGSPVPLPSIRSAAVTLDKQHADRFGADLASLSALPGPVTRSATTAALGGVERIWLDGQVTSARASTTTPPAQAVAQAAAGLDDYLTRVGAPEAWAAGLDGTGVTVAVLDTGIDSGHPALEDRIREERNFTDSGSADDVTGHGTHVASVVAGTGAGADGARQGIAPAADILNGKVLGDEGEGRLSWVIAGMEWAVAAGADIVNLSLSARADETDDPVVLALDSLARESGTLFVVAAGNSGWNGWAPESVASPGTASSALTVGAVTRDDKVAGFSGQGPTPGSYRAKPDIVAPGVAILGARAGARDHDLYVAMDGTSMATPIVAGAAALVKQQHPDWSWEQVRSAVTTSADHLERPWSTGAGRLALEEAIEVATTVVPSTLSPGPVRHPSEDPLTTTVTLRNTGSESRVYSAADAQVAPPDGTPAPADALVVTPATVTVAPRGTATLEVEFDPRRVEDAFWHGHVDLTGDDGSVLRLPFATFDEPESYWLEVTVLDRSGAPYTGGQVEVLNVDNGYRYPVRPDENGRARLRVAPGTYGGFARIHDTGPKGATLTVAGTPAVDVHADATLTIDARRAERVQAPVVRGQSTRPTEFSMLWDLVAVNGTGFGDLVTPPIEDVMAGRVFVTPSRPGVGDTFETATRWRLEPTGRRTPQTPDAYELLDVQDRLPDLSGRELTRRDVHELAEVTEHTYSAEPGAAVLRGLVSQGPRAPAVVHRREIDAPRTETVLMSTDQDVRWGYESYFLDEGDQQLYTPELVPHRPRSRVVHHFGRGMHVGIAAALHSQWDGMFLEQGVSDGERLGPIRVDTIDSATTTLYREGALVGTTPDVFGWFQPPSGEASYRLLGDVRFTDGRHTRTQWWFTSAAPTDPNVGNEVMPLLTVDYGPSVGMQRSAARGRDLRFDLRIGHLPGAAADDRIETARLQWSTDGGGTWKDTALRRTGAAEFTTTVKGKQLRRGTAVSVRLRAEDVDGNRIDQTVEEFIPLV